ncbi:ABC transporter ATP-binding protein [Shimazuella alba]|uniref:Carnitine transport ATP-binding protein OpuCA n=1 Tax=Shimazuella alba TaxID=2690964 RepID=A0A6I4VQ93_9BACL|nr:ABC transporter ATP-binding protein [Shimazuella alba]MXQ52588.1 ATP-binding cassette domain-containing protein [Shimazuella alba]
MAGSDISLKTSISLDSITKIYKGNTVIDHIDLDLQEGEFLSLLGPSGSGKTTILRMVAGLVTPDEGKVILRGEDISFTPPNKRNMGMVFQQYALFPHMTIQENVTYGLKARKLPKAEITERVQKYLELVDLKHLAGRRPRELSGGQQQRVSLARALAVEPVVLLFDEPLSNLDVRLKEQMLKEIRHLHRKLGFTAIYVTHDQNEALYLSDKIAVLNKGKIEQFSSPEEILKNPTSAFVADFFGYTNRIENVVLMDEQTAQIGDVKIPVGHLGIDAHPNDQGFLLLRLNAAQILDLQNQQTFMDEKEATAIRAEIRDSRYLGDETELRLHIRDGIEQEITVKLPQMLTPLPPEGMQIRFRFQAEAICFYKGDGRT